MDRGHQSRLWKPGNTAEGGDLKCRWGEGGTRAHPNRSELSGRRQTRRDPRPPLPQLLLLTALGTLQEAWTWALFVLCFPSLRRTTLSCSESPWAQWPYMVTEAQAQELGRTLEDHLARQPLSFSESQMPLRLWQMPHAHSVTPISGGSGTQGP